MAPTGCLFRKPDDSLVRSASADSATHGNKLYLLFARDLSAYLKNDGPIGQVLVKDSSAAIPIPRQAASLESAEVALPIPYVLKTESNSIEIPTGNPDDDEYYSVRTRMCDDSGCYEMGDPTGLFVMFKLPASTPNTDNGWVYGTVDPNGETIDVGRIASCMKCHVNAPHDRLFGIQDQLNYSAASELPMRR